MSNRYVLAALTLALALGAPMAALAQTGVSDDRVSLPEGPGSLEGVGENVSVNASMGQMSHAVPIRVPAGHNNASPSLSLGYSSGGGSGIVGIGWSMAMPYIERLTVRGLPKYSLDDEWSANTSEQLVYVPGTSPRTYRSRYEGGFVRYRWHDVTTGAEGYWTGERPDGTIDYYGADRDGNLVPSARVSGDDGTFRYHLVETVDPYGNIVAYTYAKLDGSNYTLAQQVAWGHTDPSNPTSALFQATFSYEARPDKVSDCKPGFEELLEHRLTTITVLSRGTLLRQYVLSYDDPLVSAGFSRLNGVEQLGANGSVYPIAQTFSYSQAFGAFCDVATDGEDCVKPFVVPMEGSISATIAQGDATLIDMNGDGLADVVDTSAASLAGNHRIFYNTFTEENGQLVHRFVEKLDDSLKGPGYDLSSTAVQVLDVNGDGFTDMFNASLGQVLMNYGDGDWDPVEVELWSSGDGGLPSDFVPAEGELQYVRFLDYDGDKKIDIIRSQGEGIDNTTQLFRNTGGAFQDAATVPGAPASEPIGVGFGPGTLELNDMNGDGLLDPVQVQTSSVRYKLNLGWGRWSAEWVELSIGSTSLSADEARLAELEDLNGDALADLVLVTGDVVKYWVNVNGESLEGPLEITNNSGLVDGTIPDKTDKVVLFADINGNGSSDVVWIGTNDGTVSYLDLFPVRANLLTRIENGLGKVMTMSFTSTVDEMVADQLDGTDWKYPLPHPNTVVKSVSEWDQLAPQNASLTTFRYHDGYYDGSEKNFRGYERVEQDLPATPQVQASGIEEVYDVGATDSYRNGLLTEFRQFNDGIMTRETTFTWEDCPVDGLGTGTLLFDVRHICKTKQVSEVREKVTDPAQWPTIETEWVYDGYGNIVRTSALGVTAMGGAACGACDGDADGTPCGAQCLGDERYTSSTFTRPEDNDDRWMLRYPVRERTYGVAASDGSPANSTYTEVVTYYDGVSYEGLAEGQVTKGAQTRKTTREDETGAVIESVRQAFDVRGNLVGRLHPDTADGAAEAGRWEWTMDDEGLHVVQSDILLANDDGPYRLSRFYVWDALHDMVSESTTWNIVNGGNVAGGDTRTFYGYDEFGRLVTKSVPGSLPGSPSHEIAYELGSPVSRVVTRQRTDPAGGFELETAICMDGYGRTYQTRSRVATGDWTVSGFQVYAPDGSLTHTYQPHKATSSVCDLSEPTGVPVEVYFYDGENRRILTRLSQRDDETTPPEMLVEYLPLGVVEWDAEDSRAGSPHYGTTTTTLRNGLGWILSTERMLSSTESRTHRFGYDELGRTVSLTDPAGDTRTQAFDLRGNIVETTGPNRGTVTYQYNANGDLFRRANANGTVVRYDFDSIGRVIAEWDEADEAATKVTFAYDFAPDGCAAGDCSNTAGFLSFTRFPLGDGTWGEDWHGYNYQAVMSYTRRAMGGHAWEGRVEYDLARRAITEEMPSGLVIDREYDGMGRVSAVPGYVDAVTYTADSRLNTLALANGTTQTRTFDKRLRMATSQVTNAANEPLVDHAYTRDAMGNIVEVVDGRVDDGTPRADATYSYDSFYRLTGATLEAGTDREETLAIGFDAAERITSRTSSIADSRVNLGTYTYGENGAGPQAVTTVGSKAFGYDASGQMTARDGDTLEWDAFGRLTRVTSAAGDEKAWFGYSASRERVVKRAGALETWYVFDNYEVRNGTPVVGIVLAGNRTVEIVQPSQTAAVLSDVAPASGDDAALSVEPDGLITPGDAWIAQAVDVSVFTLAGDPAPATSDVNALLEASLDRLLWGGDDIERYHHYNHLNTAAATTDANGEVVGRIEYYPYGEVRYEDGDTSRYGFTGKERDASTGLVFFGQRYLDPMTGRWLSPDPRFDRMEGETIGRAVETAAAYGFVLGDPVNMADADGEVAWMAVGAVIGGTASAIGFLARAAMTGKLQKQWKTKAFWGEFLVSTAMGAGAGALTGGLSAIGEGVSIAFTAVATVVARRKKAKAAAAGQTAADMSADVAMAGGWGKIAVGVAIAVSSFASGNWIDGTKRLAAMTWTGLNIVAKAKGYASAAQAIWKGVQFLGKKGWGWARKKMSKNSQSINYAQRNKASVKTGATVKDTSNYGGGDDAQGFQVTMTPEQMRQARAKKQATMKANARKSSASFIGQN